MTETMDMYIREQAAALTKVLDQRSHIGQQFMAIFKQAEFKRIILVASGSSYNAAVSAKLFMERLLQIEVQVKTPYPFIHYEFNHPKDSLVIGISQSGKSTTTIEGMNKMTQLGIPHAVMTTDPESPLCACSVYPIIVPCGIEKVGYVTMGYTSILLTLQIMALEAAYTKELLSSEAYAQHIQQFEQMISRVDNIISDAERWYEQNRNDLLKAERIIVVGYGPNYGTALEGYLKLNETVRCAVSGYELEEFMHGPHFELDENTYVFFIVSRGAGEARINGLQQFAHTLTEHCFQVGTVLAHKDSRDLELEVMDQEDMSMIELVIPFQVLSYRLSADRGINLSIKKFPNFHEYVRTR